MAFTGIVCVLLLCLLESRRAASCTSDDDCWGESCCEEGVCRETCSVYYCSYDYQCGYGKQCCDGICSSWCTTSSPSPTPKTGQWDYSLAITLISLFIFFAPVICCICCCCCECSPYHRYRSSTRQIEPQSTPLSTPRRAYVIVISSVTAHRS